MVQHLGTKCFRENVFAGIFLAREDLLFCRGVDSLLSTVCSILTSLGLQSYTTAGDNFKAFLFFHLQE